jgi:hypothetical protein
MSICEKHDLEVGLAGCFAVQSNRENIIDAHLPVILLRKAYD